MSSDYDRWSWIFHGFALVAGLGAAYMIHQYNPALMNQEPVRQGLQNKQDDLPPPLRFKSSEEGGEARLAAGYMSGYTPLYNGSQGENIRLNHRFRQDPEVHGVTVPVSSQGAPLWWLESDGYLALMPQKEGVEFRSLTGELQWKFGLHGRRISTEPWITTNNVLFGTEDGTVYNVDRKSGHLHWMLPGLSPLQNVAILSKSILVVEQVTSEQFRFRQLNMDTGISLGESKELPGKPTGPISYSKTLGLAYLALEHGRVLAFSPDTLETKWQKDMGVAIRGDLAIIGESLVFGVNSPALIALNTKTGDDIWQYKLSSEPKGSPVWIPSYDLVAVLTNGGYLYAVDRADGEGKWRFNTHNQSLTNELSVFRLSNSSINKLELPWHHNGWALWSPCAQNRLCIYNPGKGQLLARIPTEGAVAGRPLFVNGRLLVPVRTQEDPAQFGWARLEEVTDKNQPVSAGSNDDRLQDRQIAGKNLNYR